MSFMQCFTVQHYATYLKSQDIHVFLGRLIATACGSIASVWKEPLVQPLCAQIGSSVDIVRATKEAQGRRVCVRVFPAVV
jgi:hypothetical protein